MSKDEAISTKQSEQELAQTKPSPTEAPRSNDTPLEVILLTERKDEAAIIAEMRGAIADSYVYSFQQGNRTITSLAYPGVKEGIRRRGNVAIVPCDCCKKQYHVEETSEEFRAVVKIHDLANNVQFLGVSTCKKTLPFAYVVAANKAERNGFRKLLPEKEIALLIAQWAKSSTRRVSPEREIGPTESESENGNGQPSVDKSPTWHVPVTKSASQQGIKEEPIFYKTTIVGAVYIDEDHDELAFVPENRFRADSGPIQNFLVARVLSAEKAKHGSAFDFLVRSDSDGTLQGVLVRTEHDQDRLRKLLDAVGWAFQKSSETKT